MTTLEIEPLDAAAPDALYRHYEGQLDVQPCHIALSLESGLFTADYNPEVGSGVPESVWNNRTLWWTIPCLTAEGVNDLLDELAPLAQRVLDGATVEWDGKSGNKIGWLNSDATAASEEIAATCDMIENTDYPHVVEWDAGDWFSAGDLPEVAAETSDADLSRLADEQRQAAQTVGGTTHSRDYIVLVGLDSWFEDARREAREQVRDELEEVAAELEEITARRNELIRRCSRWMSLRAVGEAAGVSHTQVARIVSETADDQ